MDMQSIVHKENSILFDWLSFTWRADFDSFIPSFESDPDFCIFQAVLRLLGLDKSGLFFLKTFGFHGYKDRYFYDGISIMLNHAADNSGVLIEMSGQGCRNFEKYSTVTFDTLFYFFRSEPGIYNVTRLDVAYDDFNYIIDQKKMIDDIHQLNFVSKFQRNRFEIIEHPDHTGITINMGSMKSDVFFRCYDKRFERESKLNTEADCKYWVRFEMQLRHDRAYEFILKYLRGVMYSGTDHSDPECVIGKIFFGVVNNYVRFVTPDKNDSNKRRWKLRRYWTNFLQHLEKISLYTPHPVEYNEFRVCNYNYGQAGNSTKCLVNKYGVVGYFEKFLSESPDHYPVKYFDVSPDNYVIEKFLSHKDEILKIIGDDFECG